MPRFVACRRNPHDRERWQKRMLSEWERATREAYLRAYDAVARDAGLSDGLEANHSLLELFEREKALYELRYKIANRPGGCRSRCRLSWKRPVDRPIVGPAALGRALRADWWRGAHRN
jgi:hypothetical protein